MWRKKGKYGNKITTVDGIKFASMAEANRYRELKWLEQSGVISNLELQPSFVLQDKFTDAYGKKHPSIRYVADFRYIEDGATVVEDVKGVETDVFKLKKRLFLKRYSGEVEFRIIKV